MRPGNKVTGSGPRIGTKRSKHEVKQAGRVTEPGLEQQVSCTKAPGTCYD